MSAGQCGAAPGSRLALGPVASMMVQGVR